jgi:hypothetical protein
MWLIGRYGSSFSSERPGTEKMRKSSYAIFWVPDRDASEYPMDSCGSNY